MNEWTGGNFDKWHEIEKVPMKNSLNIVNVCTMHESPQMYLHMVLSMPFFSHPKPVYACVFIAQFTGIVWGLSDGSANEVNEQRMKGATKKKTKEISKPKLKPHKLHCWYSCLSCAAHAACPQFTTIELKHDYSLFLSNFCSFPLFLPLFFWISYHNSERTAQSSDSIIKFLFCVCFLSISSTSSLTSIITYCFVFLLLECADRRAKGNIVKLTVYSSM